MPPLEPSRQLGRPDLRPRHSDEDIAEARETAKLVEQLMGKKPELRFQYIQEHAQFVDQIDV